MGRSQVYFSTLEERVFYKKLEIVANKRRQPVSAYIKYLLMNAEPCVDSELNFFLDASDEDLRKQTLAEMSIQGVIIKKRSK